MAEVLFPPKLTGWIENSAAGRIASVQELRGATSSSLFRVTLNQDDRCREIVLRLFTNAGWLQEEPDLPAHEAAALQEVFRTGLPVPELIDFDTDGSLCGTPALLMTCLPGQVDLDPPDFDDWLRQQAEFLLKLHSLSGGNFAWRYRPYNPPGCLQPPPDSKVPELWQKAIEIARGPAPDYTPCFIHRDFHPVNVLWQHGRLSGVVDWVNACRGPAGVDMGWCRHNLATMYGPRAADRFLEICCEICGPSWSYDPFWDIVTLLDVLPGPIEPYSPWLDFGLDNLSVSLCTRRLETYLRGLLFKY